MNTLLATFVQALPLEAALKLRLRLEQVVDLLVRTGDYKAVRRLFSFDCEGRPWSNYDTITPDLAVDYKRMVSDQGFNYKSISKHITKMNENIAQNAENALTYTLIVDNIVRDAFTYGFTTAFQQLNINTQGKCEPKPIGDELHLQQAFDFYLNFRGRITAVLGLKGVQKTPQNLEIVEKLQQNGCKVYIY